jgi:signal transduction histidine kinase
MDDAAQSEFGRAPMDAQFTVGEFQTVSDRWLRFSRSEIRDGGFFLILSDITDMKEREENFRQAKLEAEAASASKTNFLTNMSHELRTPLNAIIGFSELMKNELLGPLGTPKYVEYAGDVLQSAYHLLEVINSVLDLAKSGAGKLELRPESVDLCEQARACEVMIATQAAQAQLNLQLILPQEPMLVIGEPAKLRQILLNLLSNSVKFTDSGGSVTLEANFRENYIVEVVVRDTGIGMSPEHLKIAMTPFGQVETGMARRYAGSGLGLPLTKALVELHGGEMIVESKLGHGTKVTIRLPHAARPGSGLKLRSRRL